MKNFFPVFKKEVKSYFASPIAYALISLFLLVSGFFFFTLYANVNFWVMSMGVQRMAMAGKLNLNETVCAPLYSNMVVIILFTVPLLTMRLFAEEKKLGTIELLFSYPIRDAEALLGKFFACLVVYCAMLTGTLLYPIMLATYGQVEWAPVFSCYLGLFLVGSAYISVGILVSSLTENQIIAGFGSFALLILFFVLGASERLVGPEVGQVLKHLAILEHFEPFAKGVIDTRDVIFYLNFTFFFLFLTLRVLESNRWRG